jgi:UDP-N-acetylmuramate--alanine ligase
MTATAALPSSIINFAKAMKPLPFARPFAGAVSDGRNPLAASMGPIHLVGIGGIGMSGIAEILHNLGYTVQGSDTSESPNVARLRAKGMEIFIGHDASHVDAASAVVISSAVKMDNPEVVAARTRRIPVVRRAEMLSELMRLKLCVSVAGTHGKTTTTSLASAMLEAGGVNPTTINGGIINAYGTNVRIGSGEWMVVEADESDGTFIKIPSTIAIITNIDPEHLDFYGSFDAVRAAFRQFIDNLPFYGVGVLCLDHPEVQQLMGQVQDRRVLSYGLSPQAQVRAVNLRQEAEGQYFDIEIAPEVLGPDAPQRAMLKDIMLPMHGLHNVRNALAAITVGLVLNMEDDAILKALGQFEGVKRRFTRTGETKGVLVIDDYGHHPAEISATLSAARQVADARGGRVIAVMQPHRYSRLASLFNEFATCFNDADAVLISDVYTAGEAPIEGIHRDALVAALKQAGHRQTDALQAPETLAKQLATIVREKDVVVCLGAGNITNWAHALPAELEAVL